MPVRPWNLMLNSGQNCRFFGLCDLKIWWMTLKKIRHLFYATSSFVHHFVDNCEFKLELQSRNSEFRSNLLIFSTCDLEILWMTLKNKRASLLSHLKLCTSFCSHLLIQTGVTVWKYPNLGQNLFWPLILTFCMGITSVNGNYLWKLPDNMRETLWKRCHRWRDRQTDRLIEPFLELLGHS